MSQEQRDMGWDEFFKLHKSLMTPELQEKIDRLGNYKEDKEMLSKELMLILL